jgi:hypothetical protein
MDERIADAMGSTGFNSSLDVLNTGLIGGILFTVVKLFKSFSDGIKVDFGKDSIIEKATSAMEELGDTMKAFQAKLKADALLRIAAAIAILTVSVIALSFVDPEDLTKALTATAVGFGQLIGVFAVLNSSVSGVGAAKITTLSVSLGLIAAALILLSVALKIFGSMEWEEIAKGLVATGALLLGLSTAVMLMSPPAWSALVCLLFRWPSA